MILILYGVLVFLPNISAIRATNPNKATIKAVSNKTFPALIQFRQNHIKTR